MIRGGALLVILTAVPGGLPATPCILIQSRESDCNVIAPAQHGRFGMRLFVFREAREGCRHFGMVRKHQTRNLEIPGSMLRIAPE
jgi:hypothetical protein